MEAGLHCGGGASPRVFLMSLKCGEMRAAEETGEKPSDAKTKGGGATSTAAKRPPAGLLLYGTLLQGPSISPRLLLGAFVRLCSEPPSSKTIQGPRWALITLRSQLLAR